MTLTLVVVGLVLAPPLGWLLGAWLAGPPDIPADERGRGTSSRRAAFPSSADAAKEFAVTRLSIMLTIAAVLAGAAPAPASAQQQGVPLDQGNGNWDPPPVTSPTTQR
jgi:hypothetical protein